MNTPAAFTAPEPVVLAIRASISSAQTVARLERAVGERTVALLVTGLVVWLAFIVAVLGPTWSNSLFGAVGVVCFVVGGAWTVRHNQRVAMRNVPELQRLLEGVLAP